MKEYIDKGSIQYAVIDLPRFPCTRKRQKPPKRLTVLKNRESSGRYTNRWWYRKKWRGICWWM